MRQDCGSTRDCYFTECTQGVLLILTGYLLVRLWRLPANTSSAHANSDDFDEMLLIIFPLELHFVLLLACFSTQSSTRKIVTFPVIHWQSNQFFKKKCR